MKKIIITGAALLAITGSAFAQNDNVGGTNINTRQQAVDSSYTSSIQNSGSAVHQPVNEGAPRLGGNS